MASRRGPDNSVRIAISGAANGVNMANVFHAQLTTGSVITQADLDAWCDAFATAYKTRFDTFISSACSWNQAQAVLYAPGGGELTSQRAVTGAGTGAAGVTGQQLSMCISWLSSVYWRGGKPRTYLPILPSALLSNDKQIVAATAAAAQVAAAAFITDIDALTQATIATTKFGFVSFYSGNALRTPPLFFAISGARVHPRPATQRRRLGKWVA